MRRLLDFLAALLLTAVPLGLRPAGIWAVPTCFGQSATHVMQPGEGPYLGTDGPDVVVWSDGPNGIILHICGGGGDDSITVGGPSSKADGGAGRDKVSSGALARGGGGSGGDIVRAESGATGDGGSGNDTVQGADAVALLGGSGGDTVVNEGGTPKIDCGSAYDLVQANGATDVRRCEAAIAP